MSTPAPRVGTPESVPSAIPPLRFVTAASLFDGHDASINIMRRILQSQGVEVIHLGHNRSVAEIVDAAVQEDANGIAISSYQGGHVEYFEYMIQCLREKGAGHIPVFGGGGGVIVADEIQGLHDFGVARIYSPEDGQRLGLVGMIEDMISDASKRCSAYRSEQLASTSAATPLFAEYRSDFDADQHRPLAKLLTSIENDDLAESAIQQLATAAKDMARPVP